MSMVDNNRPTALLVGPMKCGTSWVHNYLSDRGDICLPRGIKETFYFDRYPRRGIAWYEKHFAHFNVNQHKAIIEVAPSLFHKSASVAPNILHQLGNIPIVITLRDPIKRSWSHYQHMARGYTSLTLEEAVEEFPEILGASRYSLHIPIWQMHFSNITVLRQSRLKTDAESYVRMLSNGLNLPTIAAGERAMQRSNAATVPRSYLLARIGRYGARSFRYLGLYSVVNAMKNAGLKHLFFGGGQIPPQGPSDKDLAFLEAALVNEVAFFASLKDFN